MAIREIIEIDEHLCDGCGDCVSACAEGALAIIDGKARLVSDSYCDGLGACLGECHTGALKVIQREAPEFDEAAVEVHLQNQKQVEAPLPSVHGGCPGSAMRTFEAPAPNNDGVGAPLESALAHWPCKLKLVPPHAPFIQGADLLLAADCVPFAHASFHRDILPGHAVVIGCPKFDDPVSSFERLKAMLETARPKSLTVAMMEVPCCHGYYAMARKALEESGLTIPLRVIEVHLNGKIKQDVRVAVASPPRAEV